MSQCSIRNKNTGEPKTGGGYFSTNISHEWGDEYYNRKKFDKMKHLGVSIMIYSSRDTLLMLLKNSTMRLLLPVLNSFSICLRQTPFESKSAKFCDIVRCL